MCAVGVVEVAGLILGPPRRGLDGDSGYRGQLGPRARAGTSLHRKSQLWLEIIVESNIF